MAKTKADAGIDGRVITVDVLPHLRRQIWNCIDEHDGPRYRAEILAPWGDLLKKIVFLQGDTLSTLPKLGEPRIHFAFLDAQHIKSSVLQEFGVVQSRQIAGDIVFFGDVTPKLFPGVVEAIEQIERGGEYQLTRLPISDQRGYAWGVRV